MYIQNTKIVLASKSPRRLQLLQSLGYEVEVQTMEVEETFPNEIEIIKVPEFLAQKKVQTLLDAYPTLHHQIVLGADTIVVAENEILGKPNSLEEAIQTLQKLSGREHQVISGVCISQNGQITTFSSITKVLFKTLNEADIKYYVSQFQPLDKAGSYAIQEWIGMIGIEKIEGDYYNVMGLPVNKVYAYLR